jgi:nucleotide-binding universal stress UspA family protein
MISTIAVGTDGSASATEAVRMAADIARRFDAKLVLVGAFLKSGKAPMDRGGDPAEVQWAFSSSARVQEILTRSENELKQDGIACSTLVDEGDPAEVIVRLAEECGADLLVIGNRGMQRRVLGSVPNTITHRAPCSVLVAKTT